MTRPAVRLAVCAIVPWAWVQAGACAAPDSYLVVTVDARPAVHGAEAVTVALSNAGTTRRDSLALAGHAFPVTFSISAPDRTGELAISVDAVGPDGIVVGHGSATTTADAATAQLTLDSTDFVVNTSYATDQFPSSDFEAAGFQLAALPDGTWTAVYREEASSLSAELFARRFDRTGAPVASELAPGGAGFALSSQPTRGSTPAVAASQTTTLAVWDFFATGDATGQGIACRAIDAAGRSAAAEVLVADDAADVVSVTALPSGDFLAVWSAFVDVDHVIKALVIRPDCTAPAPSVIVSTAGDDAERGAVAAGVDRAVITWLVDGELHVRVATATGQLVAAEQTLIARTASEQVSHARIAAVAGGFVVAARWTTTGGDGPGRIELLRLDASGARSSGPALVTDRGGSDLASAQSFGLAGRADGSVLVAWHSCGALGDGNLCGVFGRILRDTGEPLTDAFVIPTTTEADQVLPSVIGLDDAFVAVWSDASAAPPDTAGLAVRARVIYPPPVPTAARTARDSAAPVLR